MKEGFFMWKKSLLVGLLFAGAIGSTDVVRAASCSSSCNTGCPVTTSSGCSSSSECGCPCAGKTFFTNRPLYQTARPEYVSGFLNDKMVAANDGFGGAFEAVVFGGKATQTRNLAQYFLPNCKQTLRASEVDSTTNIADLQAHNFNIFTLNDTFNSNICFNARASEYGVGLHYLQGFCFNDDRSSWWYADISMPITHVNSELILTETVINNGGGVNSFASTSTAVANMTQAFAQSAWCFGKIDSCASHGKTGVADIEVKLGYQWKYSPECHIATYFGFVAPTGNKAKSEYLFEPIVGNGKHWGLMWGQQSGFEIWNSCNENWHVNFEVYTNATYLFENKQVRSFDLKGKPWSRYLAVYANEAAATAAEALGQTLPGANAATPGINIFTQCVKVQPRFQFNMTSLWKIHSDCGFEAEAGYNFYAREKECVTLANAWKPGPAIKDILGAGQTNPVANITANTLLINSVTPVSLANYSNSLILASDLDLDSAAHPSIITNTIYGALGYKFEDMCTPVHVNLGGSYEFAGKNFAVMNRWTLWGKAGISF